MRAGAEDAQEATGGFAAQRRHRNAKLAV